MGAWTGLTWLKIGTVGSNELSGSIKFGKFPD
jgi:hypothetical protein